MKKFFFIFTAALYLIASTGLLLKTHYCGENLIEKRISIVKEITEGCCEEEEEANTAEDGCCKDELALIKIKQAQQIGGKLKCTPICLSILPLFTANCSTSYSLTCQSYQSIKFIDRGPPPKTNLQKQSLLCSFLI